MIIDRRTFVAKKGRVEEAAQLLLGLRSGDSRDTSRGKVMVAAVGPFDIVCTEIAFEDWAAYHSFWENEFAPDADWWDKWNAVTESGGTHEIWRVLD